MHAARKYDIDHYQQLSEDTSEHAAYRGLSLLKGSRRSARNNQALVGERRGRIQMVGEPSRAEPTVPVVPRVAGDDPVVLDAHRRLRLPSLERWLEGHSW